MEHTIQTDHGDVKLVCKEITCYITESKPTGKTNLAFNSEVVFNHHILEQRVDPEAATSFFLRPKKESKDE